MAQKRNKPVSRRQRDINIGRATDRILRRIQALGLQFATPQIVRTSAQKFNVSESRVTEKLQQRGIPIQK